MRWFQAPACKPKRPQGVYARVAPCVLTMASQTTTRDRQVDGEGVSMGECSCGNTEPHVISRRATADGKHILQWDDGTITWGLGYKIRNAPRGGSDFARRVGGLVIGDASLYEASEIPSLIEAARFVAKRSGLPNDMRKRYREITRSALSKSSFIP